MQTSGSLRSNLALILMVVVLATRTGLEVPQNPRPNCVEPAQPPSEIFLSLWQTIADADYDGDHLPDRAELISHGFLKDIHLTFSSPRMTSLDFPAETQQAGSLLAEDIDHDSDNDLVWVSDQQLTHTALWINNGIGEFTRINNHVAYTAEIHRLVVRKRGNNLSSSLADSRLSAISTSRSIVLARPHDRLLEIAFFTFIPDIFHCCADQLSSCTSHYPKRGPPFFPPRFNRSMPIGRKDSSDRLSR